jgi:TRAP-type C4-dicarboxylate transport system substrate-binding protein
MATWLKTALAVASVTLALSASAQDYPDLNLKLAHFVPSNITGSKIDQWFADEVAKRSGGKIKIKIFWSESMGKAAELIQLVGSGAVDLAAVSPGYFPDRLPLSGATNSVMMQFETNAQAVRATSELVEKFPDVQAELKRNNVYPIFFHSLNTYRLFCTKPVETMADLKGLKIRSWGEYIPIMWNSVGAVPVTVMTPDVYESLQRGTIDCAFFPNDLSYSLKLYEVAKYAWDGDSNFGAIPTWPIWANWNTWHNVWPESVRKLLTAVGREAMERDIKEVRADEDKALKEMVDKHGVKVVHFRDMDKVRATIPDLAEVWIKKMKAKGLEKDAKELSRYWKKRDQELKADASR